MRVWSAAHATIAEDAAREAYPARAGLYGIPTGDAAVGRLDTTEEWTAQLIEWESSLPKR